MLPKSNPKKKPLKPLNNYARYSSIGLQMVIIILIGVFGGMKIDEYFNIKFPVFTVILSFLSVVLAIYSVVRDLLKK